VVEPTSVLIRTVYHTVGTLRRSPPSPLLMDLQNLNTFSCTHTAGCSQFYSPGTRHAPARPTIQPSDT
jgi:hypothetical protein